MASNFNLGSIFADLKINSKDFVRGLRNSEKEVKKFAKEAERGLNGAERAGLRLQRRIRSLDSSFASLGRRVVSFGRSVAGIRGILAGVGAAFVGFRVARFAGELENAERSFGSLARSLGDTAPRFLDKLQQATKGTVSEFELLRVANQAVLLGVGATTDQIAKLADGARRLGRAAGRTTSEAFGDLATGIGRQSKLILDNLGIIVSIEKANEAYAKALGKTASALTDAEKKQAFFNATVAAIDVSLAKLGPDFISFADVFNQVTASASNLGTQITRNITPSLRSLLVTIRDADLGTLSASVGAAISAIIDQVNGLLKDGGLRSLIEDFEVLLAMFTAFARDPSLAISVFLDDIKLAFSNFFISVAEIVLNVIIEGLLSAFPALRTFQQGPLRLDRAERTKEEREDNERLVSSFAESLSRIRDFAANFGPQAGPAGFQFGRGIKGLDDIEQAERRREAQSLAGAAALVDSGPDVAKRLGGSFLEGIRLRFKAIGGLIALAGGQSSPSARPSEISEAQKGFRRAAQVFSQDLGFGLLDALQRGTSVVDNLAETFARSFERKFSDILNDLGKKLGDAFFSFFESNPKLGGLLGGLVTGGLALGLNLLGKKGSSSVTQIPTEEIATSQAAVRGVVAGPTSVAIAEVGAGIREANRGVESLLSDILGTLREISFESRLSAGGAGTAGAI